MVSCGFRVFQSKITKGGNTYPEAFVHASTVICVFVSLVTYDTAFMPEEQTEVELSASFASRSRVTIWKLVLAETPYLQVQRKRMK